MGTIILGSATEQRGITVNPETALYNGNNVEKIMHGTKIIWISKPVALIPPMNSNTTPSGVASASSASANYPAWRAFNGVETNAYSDGWYPAGDGQQWLQYKFDAPVCVRKVVFMPDRDNTNGSSVATYRIQASNNGTNFTNLTDVLSNQSQNTKVEVYLNNTTEYLYYRMTILTSGGSFYYCGLGYMQLYG